MLFGLVLTAVLGEIALRLITSRTLIYNIEMVKYAKQLKIADPKHEVSHVHRTNASAKLMGVQVRLNALGNRGPDLAAVKTPGTRRVLVLGSSVTMGWGVPEDRVFTSLMENRARSEKRVLLEFANAGIGNYNTFAQSRRFRDQYPVVNPDLVILQYFISDVEPRSLGNNNAILKYSLLADFLYDRLHVLGFLSRRQIDLFHYYSAFYQDGNEHWAKTIGYISKMRDRTNVDGVPFVIMVIPDLHNVGPGSPYGALYAKMDSAFERLGIPTVDAFVPFQKAYGGRESDLWIQPDDPHPNARGHRLMADILYEYLLGAALLERQMRG